MPSVWEILHGENSHAVRQLKSKPQEVVCGYLVGDQFAGKVHEHGFSNSDRCQSKNGLVDDCSNQGLLSDGFLAPFNRKILD